MGFGRSGTSLMGGILHQMGFYMGENLYPPRDSNPRGFFECDFINGINERILKPYDYNLSNKINPEPQKLHSPFSPGEGHRWLAYITRETIVDSTDSEVLQDIRKATSIKNFAYKDPRFNYTLDVWMPYLKEDVVFICMFRNPAETVESVVTECATAEYLTNFSITHHLTERLWLNSYSHLLLKVKPGFSSRFVFIHYHQLLSGSIMEKLSNLFMTKIDNQFVEKKLNRTRTKYQVMTETDEVYEHLCNLAQFDQEDC